MSIKNTFTQEALHGYVAPSASVLDCQSEGLLCGSGDLTIKDWERDENGLDFNI